MTATRHCFVGSVGCLLLMLLAGCAGAKTPAGDAQARARATPRAVERQGVVVIGDGRGAGEPAVAGSAGWADALGQMWRAGVSSQSFAVSQGTLASYLKEGHLERALATMPAYVIIGFGQGDADAGTKLDDFEKQLDSVVAQVKASGAAAVLVTPPALRKVEPLTGKAMGKPPADAAKYAEVILKLAARQQLKCIDLHSETARAFKEYGDRANWFLHPPADMSKEPRSFATHPKSRPKPTPRNPAYFSATGADSLAQAIAMLLREQDSPLAASLRPMDGAPTADYQLTWRDEFEGEKLSSTWSCRYPGVRKDGINDPKCIRLDGQGHLVIDIKKVGDKVHSALVGTQQKKLWTHGYMECRMTLPSEPGLHAGFWLTSDRMAIASTEPAEVDQTRRNGVEIDVMEYASGQGDVVHMNVHWNGYKESHRSSPFDVWVPRLRQNPWHVFGVEWTTQGYTFYVDGRRAWSTTDAPSDAQQYIILSVEIDRWAGDVSKARLPQEVKVDWVRVWQKAPAAEAARP